MNAMITEILACIAAAGALGLFCGWMVKAASAKRKLRMAEESWSEKLAAADERNQQDIENLEDQLQQMGDEVKTLTHSNRALNESLKKNEASVYKSRTDAIELNRQQAETQERLQRIIMEKDDELNKLKNTSTGAELGKAAAAAGVSAAVAAKASDVLKADASNADDISARVDTLAAKREAWERERQSLADTLSEDQQTVALDQSDLPNEQLDKTVKLDTDTLGKQHTFTESTLDNTDQLEDSTLAMDDLDDTLSMTDQPDLGGKPKFDNDGS